MIYLTAILIVLGGLGYGTVLVLNGHPWFGLLVMLITISVRVRTGSKCKCEETKDAS